jgi:hypothetical protein
MMSMTIPRITILAIAAAIVAACASAPRAANRGASCPLTQSDSAYLARGPVYRECAVDIKARKIPDRSRVDFTPPRAGATSCYAVEVELVVDSLGKPETETARVVRSTDRTFADAVMQTVRDWRYEAAMLDHRPVRQIVLEKQTSQAVVVAAGGRPPTGGMAPRANC